MRERGCLSWICGAHNMMVASVFPQAMPSLCGILEGWWQDELKRKNEELMGNNLAEWLKEWAL